MPTDPVEDFLDREAILDAFPSTAELQQRCRNHNVPVPTAAQVSNWKARGGVSHSWAPILLVALGYDIPYRSKNLPVENPFL